MNNINEKQIERFFQNFSEPYKERILTVVDRIVKLKEENKKIVVVTGSGPNIHEGITTLISELIKKEIIDGVLTSSAVIAHEMAGALDRVKRVSANLLDFKQRRVDLPKGDIFELTLLSDEKMKKIEKEIGELDWDLIEQLKNAEGKIIIKAAGNMAYPMGLRTEMLASEIGKIARETLQQKYSFEFIAGLGADPRTMIGAAAKKGIPVMVSIPQMVGGGMVGIEVGDSISIYERSKRNAKMLGDADMIIESGLALAQEIHDGPFETYTGHGIWSQWRGDYVYSLKGKTLVRFDLDSNLEKVWQQQRSKSLIQQAIADGKPKTKLTGVPFRMEMSGFARLETSIPIIGDIGEIWPVVAYYVSKDLGVTLDFMSYKQETEDGKKMREYIVEEISEIDKEKMLKAIEDLQVH